MKSLFISLISRLLYCSSFLAMAKSKELFQYIVWKTNFLGKPCSLGDVGRKFSLDRLSPNFLEIGMISGETCAFGFLTAL